MNRSNGVNAKCRSIPADGCVADVDVLASVFIRRTSDPHTYAAVDHNRLPLDQITV